ncbi:MAG: transcription antitermination factor NusB [Candidatus Marinimicrobia bacterium]|nr:transcription antitermination factor NusB [Candidatus Neomarinimicrobiota bacterium]
MMKLRRLSRELSLQVLYALEMNDKPIDQVILDILLLNDNPECDETLLRELVHVTTVNKDAIDERIRSRSKNWDFTRIALIDKIILRQSIAELMFCKDIPPRVTISEAIELGKKYSTEDSHIFINGLMDRIYHDLIEEGRIFPEITET